MKAEKVTPQKWLWDAAYPLRVLYDDGDYSIIWSFRAN
jgi:hypothetical protein